MIAAFKISIAFAVLVFASPAESFCQDSVADNMLLFQRSVGGWPKHYHEVKIDYSKVLSPSERAEVAEDSSRNDATIDNDATTKEIRYLLKAYKQVKKNEYLAAAERGIRYLLKAQYENGGWPQFYPDFSAYRSEITYNDNAMTNVLNVLFDLVKHKNDFDVVDKSLVAPSKLAIEKGIDCILKTQVAVNRKLTVWCAQYDCKTMQPAKARSFELISLSGSESVGIILFLMRIEHPSDAVKNSVKMALEWFDEVKINGYDFVDIPAPNTPKGIDRALVKDEHSVIWARFYTIDNNEPFVCGRDGIKKKKLEDIEYERRTGYAWYGKWPQNCLTRTIPNGKKEFTLKRKMKNVKTYRWLKQLSIWLIILLIVLPDYGYANGIKIVVDQAGKGNFKSVQEAINSIKDGRAETVTIYIKKGIYKETVFIEKNNIILEGEDRDHTILSASIARDEFRCDHADDWGVATLNINANDITLKDLTVENRYGMDWTGDRIIACKADTVKHEKKIGKTGHQMALRTDKATRLQAINCHFNSLGGDTVSPWNVEDGMFFFKDCLMEGAVDFYCPRGYAYAKHCRFIAHSGDACIWHDGSKAEDSKTVLKDCTFEGYDSFKLGRYHRDAQFYLVNCSFAANMADKAIYRVPTINVIQWGHRVYFFDCHKKGGDYAWFTNNLNTAPGNPDAKNINANWTFHNKWSVDE